MEWELFSTLPQAAQMAGARLHLALGAFGSRYSSLLATVHLSLSSLSLYHISTGRKRLLRIFALHTIFTV